MGRLVLLTALLLVGGATGCQPDPGVPETARTDPTPASFEIGDPHDDLACAECHAGDLADGSRALPAVPRSTCASSKCHTTAGPARIVVAGVEMQHRGHGGGEPVAMACAGCHTHDSGNDALSAGTGSCGLCHAADLDGDTPEDCRLCHVEPTHVALSSQHVAIPHEEMPWIEGECVRCHYEVDAPETRVGGSACATCHRELASLTTRSIGEDLHPDHAQVSCTACHQRDSHRVVSMSSAVDLVCGDCHLRSHDIEVVPTFRSSGICTGCHRDDHAPQQRLVLGVVPEHPEARPSDKFLDGLTCRSCHVSAETTHEGSDRIAVGSEVSCAGCHRPEYAVVLGWWKAGSAQRLSLVDIYLDRIAGLLGSNPSDTAAALLETARRTADRVRAGGGSHNLTLSHELLTQSLSGAGAAALAADRAIPTAPDLGRRPRTGLCSYCHYRLDDAMRYGDAEEAFRGGIREWSEFHREALGIGEPGSGGG